MEHMILKPPRAGHTMEKWTKPGSSREEPANTSDDHCTQCGKVLVPPVTRCDKGHGICYICLHRSKQDCSCGEAFQKEYITKNVPPDTKFSCMHRGKGCTQKLPLDVLQEHEATCPYNPNSPVIYCHIL